MKTKEEIEGALVGNYKTSVQEKMQKFPDERYTHLLEGNLWTLGVFNDTPLIKDVVQEIEVKFFWFKFKTKEPYSQAIRRVALKYIKDNKLEERYGKLELQ